MSIIFNWATKIRYSFVAKKFQFLKKPHGLRPWLLVRAENGVRRPARRTAAKLLFFTTLENLQREDLSTLEAIEAVVEILDTELIGDKEYASTGRNPADRVKALLQTSFHINQQKTRL